LFVTRFRISIHSSACQINLVKIFVNIPILLILLEIVQPFFSKKSKSEVVNLRSNALSFGILKCAFKQSPRIDHPKMPWFSKKANLLKDLKPYPKAIRWRLICAYRHGNLRVHSLRYRSFLGYWQVWLSNSAFMESRLWSPKRSMEIGGVHEFLPKRQLVWERKLYCQEPMAVLIL